MRLSTEASFLKLNTNEQMLILAIFKQYKRFVANRTGRDWVSGDDFTSTIYLPLLKKIKNPKLAKLFVEAQFASLPKSWCKETFGLSYPPATVAFSDNCNQRYEEYIKKGDKIGRPT